MRATLRIGWWVGCAGLLLGADGGGCGVGPGGGDDGCTAGDTKTAEDDCNTCTCSDEGSWACTEMACVSTCVRDGVSYDAGETVPANDGCNTCLCAADGSILCTTLGCVQTCTYDGVDYLAGDTFAATDGCNDCTCLEDGNVACTTIACATGCTFDGVYHEDGETFPAGDGCNLCTCSAQAAVCTDASCEPLCAATGGTWDVTSCGDYACGAAPECAAVIPGCDCGAFANFVAGEGCLFDPTCPDACWGAWLDPNGTCRTPADGVYPDDCCAAESAELLCDATGGTWDIGSCGHYDCGQVPACAAALPGCDCGETHNFVDGAGCVFAPSACCEAAWLDELDQCRAPDDGPYPALCCEPAPAMACIEVTDFQCGFAAECVDGVITASWHEHILDPTDPNGEVIVDYECEHPCPLACDPTADPYVWPANGVELASHFCR